MGTTAPARAVALGTKKARMIDTKIAPNTIAPVFTPTFDKMYNANRLCKFVACIAAARKRAAATSATAEFENPASAIFNAPFVPTIFSGFAMSGENPISNAIKLIIIAALTG